MACTGRVGRAIAESTVNCTAGSTMPAPTERPKDRSVHLAVGTGIGDGALSKKVSKDSILLEGDYCSTLGDE